MSNKKPLPVPGYTDQNQEKIDLVAANKMIEELVLRQIHAVSVASGMDIDQRWVSIAATNIEQGFMALNRAVFQPQRINIDPIKMTHYVDALLSEEEKLKSFNLY